MTTSLHETPLFFTAADRPLYAVYHTPARQRAGAPVVVHCHAIGGEQMTSNRTEVTMARAAAAGGFPVFRFHARGHGDSAGDFADVTLEGLADDARAAANEARARSGTRRVVWFGLRFGALVAAEAIRRGGDAAGLALWEPVHQPQDYARSLLRGLLFSQMVKGRPDTTMDDLLARLHEDGRVDVHGYYLHNLLLQSAEGSTLSARLGGWSGPTLIAQVQSRRQLAPAHAALSQALIERGAAVRPVLIQEDLGWAFNSNPPWMGTDLIRQTVEWLDALA